MSAEQAVAVEELRHALRGLAKGVVIIAARDGASRYAMAATAVTPLSFDPPSMLACVNETASIYQTLRGGAGFSINILWGAHEPLARLCSSGDLKGEARFAQGAWAADDAGVPYLRDAVAILCAGDGARQYGTHGIFIGLVRSVHGAACADPLVYFDGRYTALAGQRTQSLEDAR